MTVLSTLLLRYKKETTCVYPSCPILSYPILLYPILLHTPVSPETIAVPDQGLMYVSHGTIRDVD